MRRSKEEKVAWLKAHGIYDAWLENVLTQYDESRMTRCLEDADVYDPINSAFTWSLTPQGHDFWHDWNVRFVEWADSDEPAPEVGDIFDDELSRLAQRVRDLRADYYEAIRNINDYARSKGYKMSSVLRKMA